MKRKQDSEAFVRRHKPHRKLLFNALRFSALTASLAPAAETVRPNILFIAVDDLRPQLGCYGNAQMKTPNIDRLAGQGVLFRRAYCQFAVCGPSRASVLSGMYPEHSKVQDNVLNFRQTVPDTVSLPQYFRENGYQTVGMGKIFHHMANTDPASWSRWENIPGRGYFLPQNIEDQKKRQAGIAAREAAGEKFTEHQKYVYTVGPFSEAADADEAGYPDGELASKAIGVLRGFQGSEEPFFLAVGFLKPHLPLIVPKKYWDLYDPEQLPVPENMSFPQGAPAYAAHDSFEARTYSDLPKSGPIPDEVRRRITHGYYAACSFIDAQVGKVLNELTTLGMESNTVIVLWGDNGFHLGDNGIIGKDTDYEAAARCPLIVCAPSLTPERTDRLVELVDIFPTLCDLAGLAIPPQCDGKSLMPLLIKPDQPWKTAAFTMNRRNWQHPNAGYSMRTDRYRYVRWLNPTGDTIAEELYDYEKDAHETRNLISNPEYEPVVKDLRKQFDAESPLMIQRGGQPKKTAERPASAVTDTPVAAGTVTDHFDRKSTAFVGKEASEQLGEGWKTDAGSKWRITENRLNTQGSATPPFPVLYHAAMVTKNTDKAGFKLSGTVMLKTESASAFAGLCCNYQDSEKQYVFRFSGDGRVQFLRQNSKELVFNKANAFKQVAGTSYKLTIRSVAPYAFKLTIENAESGEVLFAQEVADAQHSYVDGCGGVYSTCGVAYFDDIVCEPLRTAAGN
ncbi:MAG: sulfatase [Kiritimatiellaceae bacterium]|nr:sulfatase [Kiritimatiellaceae bacterium]